MGLGVHLSLISVTRREYRFQGGLERVRAIDVEGRILARRNTAGRASDGQQVDGKVSAQSKARSCARSAPGDSEEGSRMAITPAIDPRLLAAAIDAAVAELNRLANLAGELRLTVEAVLMEHRMQDQPAPRPTVSVRAVAPL